ncbi:MAG: YicC/YloC family endoribonuclease [Vicingaceae bacterium]
MIQSMTGFGKAEGQIADKKVIIQLKSLNSKQSDINVKLPNAFKEKELPYRKQLHEKLGRGKVEMYLNYEDVSESGGYRINEKVFKAYYQQLQELETELDAKSADLSSIVSRFPEVIQTEEAELQAKEWEAVEGILGEAIQELIQFRTQEGASLQADLKSHIESILSLLQEALKYENERIEIVKQRLQKNLEESEQKEKIDQDRFEQELIFYMEKYDVSEEKVRLEAHCNYFLEVMEAKAGQGRKLGFIGQEIGREINTLGSKANHAEMQRLVVQMKDALEKIKEQVLNVW